MGARWEDLETRGGPFWTKNQSRGLIVYRKVSIIEISGVIEI
jgi:hypothetical protein